MTAAPPPTDSYIEDHGICPTGKNRFDTGAQARKWAKTAQKRHGGPRLQAFRCEHCDWWHIGRAPAGLKRGEFGREDIRQGIGQYRSRTTRQ